MFVLMPEAGLGEESREGKEGRIGSRKEECHRFTNSRKVTQPLSVPYLSQKCLSTVNTMSHGRISVLRITTSLRELSSTDIFCCILASNVTILISYLLFPENVFLLHFLIFVREGTKFSLGVYSEKNALGAPSCL